MTRWIYIALFGLLGVFARYAFGQWAVKALPPPFPYGTFIINIAGAFIIGAIYVLGFEKLALSPDLRIGVMVGFLGGFTTFSSYCLEVVRLVEASEYLLAALYLGLSPALGVLATLGGIALTRRLTS